MNNERTEPPDADDRTSSGRSDSIETSAEVAPTPSLAPELPPTSPPLAPASLADMSDEDLVVLAQHKDLAAFEVLATRHEERVFGLAMRLLRNESDAQEVVQETLVSAWKNLARFEGKAQFGSWIYRIGANAALMLMRSRKRHPQISIEDVGDDGLDSLSPEVVGSLGAGVDWSRRPDEQLQSDELRKQIQHGVDLLPEATRAVFMLRDVDGLSTEETADVLGLSVPAVKTRLHRARLALREVIGAYFARV